LNAGVLNTPIDWSLQSSDAGLRASGRSKKIVTSTPPPLPPVNNSSRLDAGSMPARATLSCDARAGEHRVLMEMSRLPVFKT